MTTSRMLRPRLSSLARRGGRAPRAWRRGLGIACACAGLSGVFPDIAWAQGSLAGPSSATGLLSPIVTGAGDRSGWLYYGINAADRGLGYQGSYMTLGGFIPYAEDDLGGLWSADLRSHLSVYGGFFSNVGLVRKQFIGGSLLGVGVYWDYDGDQNQSSDTVITDSSGSYLFGGGQTYNQVGVSGEWLTDYGNLRSNGYIPVGTTAALMGPFVGSSLLAVNGLNAALGGADLEVGAYIPGLTDWAGMISVGGYALGNTSYSYLGGAEAVPAFGGVYTRLDMTFIENWDFSLQANNDSFFDWTGFARLTYRIGGSRRRNVPDQMEQPMMRNEHIVRAHRAPVQAVNPVNGLPWRIVHVDNSSAVVGPGAGTIENPYKTLLDGRDNATLPFDVIYLHTGISQQIAYSIPVPPASPLLNPDPLGAPPVYPNLTTPGSFYFQADNQYLVGEGSSLRLNTVGHGPIGLAAGPGNAYPVIANAAGAAIILTDPAGTVTNAVVDHIAIRDSYVGISDGPAGLPTDGYATVNDVRIDGTGPSQRGVEITAPGVGRSTINFSNMRLRGLTRDGFVVSPVLGGLGDPQVNITDAVIRDTDGSAIVAQNMVGESRVRADNVVINNTSRSAVLVQNGQLSLLRSRISDAGIAGVTATDASTVQIAQNLFERVDIGVQATSDIGQLNITINDNRISTTARGNGIVLSTPDPENGATVLANVVGNTFPQISDQDIVLFDGDPGGGGPGSANLFIKASNVDNLRALNADATVLEAFPNNPTPAVPPPPNYNPALNVPLPPQ
jgi:hypothetical protein